MMMMIARQTCDEVEFINLTQKGLTTEDGYKRRVNNNLLGYGFGVLE